MKIARKILATMLVLIMLVSILPIISNAATITINDNENLATGSTTYDVYQILVKTDNGYSLTAEAAKYFITDANVQYKLDDDENFKNFTKVEEVLEFLTDLANGSTSSESAVEYQIVKPETNIVATADDFAIDYKAKVENYGLANHENGLQKNEINTITLPNGYGDGYYLIYDTDGEPKSHNILVEVKKGTAEVNLKAIAVTVDKEATEGDSYYVGDIVNYEINTVVPDLRGYNSYTFKITDTPTYLTIQEGSVVVKVGNTVVATRNTEIVNEIQYTLSRGVTVSTDNNVLTINLGNYLLANKENLTAGTEIKVTYNAEITKDAIVPAKATNEVELEYSNDPNTTDSKNTTTDEETVYTYSVTFNKKSILGKDLTGAKFVLKDSTGKYIKIDNATSESTQEVTLVDDVNEASTFEGGTFTISGLKEGTYTLVETDTPEGYEANEDKEFTFTISNDNGTHQLSKADGASLDVIDEIIYFSEDDRIFDVNVINAKDTFLPSTGGVGTVIFTVIGVTLMAGAVVALIVINKKNNK